MKNALISALLCGLAVVASAQTPPPTTTPPPVPRPFPGSSQPPASTAKPPDPVPSPTPQPPAPQAAPVAAPQSANPAVTVPNAQELGIQVPQTAEYLESFDAGKGQRYYIFGTNDAYVDVVTYFKTFKLSTRELFRAPAMQQFDLATFKADTMSYPPSVVVKDYTWNASGTISEGYVFISGTKERRYKTIIQIVPPPK